MGRKYMGSLALLLCLIGLTCFVIVQNNDMTAVFAAISAADTDWLLVGAAAALFFVVAEGGIIWYLLRTLGLRIRMTHCAAWSFIGFFFSGITPSATGGQPVQLFYMKREGLSFSETTPVLMVVAVLYKFVLAVLGILFLLFRGRTLAGYFGQHVWLFYLGIILNIAVVMILIWVMVTPQYAERAALYLEGCLVRVRILRVSQEREEKIRSAVKRYGEVVQFFRKNPKKIAVATGMTLIQRSSLFLLTWCIYCSMGLYQESIWTIMMLQAAVYIAVDMLPFPGAAGISELVYTVVFASVFPGELLAASLCISRGISFYFVLLFSAAVWGIWHCYGPNAVRKKEKRECI